MMGMLVLDERCREDLTNLVHAHQARIRAFLCRFEPNHDLVDELTQDVFISIIPRCEELSCGDEEETAAYLRGVARNLIRMRWRKQKIRTNALAVVLSRALQAPLDRDADDTDARVNALKSCLRRLARHAYQLVEDHCFKGMPLEEIALSTRQSSAALRMTLLRIRRSLKTCIEAGLKESAS
jgi:RNA polymerase sigma factor (sigma-70 family)